jgi:hypothetical protein
MTGLLSRLGAGLGLEKLRPGVAPPATGAAAANEGDDAAGDRSAHAVEEALS